MTIRQLSDLPDEVRDFLLDSSGTDAYNAFIQTYGLSKDAFGTLFELVQQLTLGWYPLEKLPEILAAEFDVDQTVSTKMAIDLAGSRLLPISAIIGDVAGQITKWGGDLKKFEAVPKVDIQQFSAEQFVKDTLAQLAVKMPNANLQSRLEFILTAFAKGVRDENETKAVLLRSPKVGGIEFTPEAADKLMASFIEKMKFAKVDFAIRTSERSQPSTVNRPAASVAQAAKPTVGAPTPPDGEHEDDAQAAAKAATRSIGHDTFNKKDEEEIKRAASILKQDVASEPAMTVMDDAIKHILDESKLAFKDEDTRKRFVEIATARLKDIRDAYETRTRLEDTVEKGGLGLAGAELVRVDQIIEHVFDEWKKVSKKKEEQVRQQAAAEKQRTVVPPPAPPAPATASPAPTPAKQSAAPAPTAPTKPPAPKPITPRLSTASVPPSPGKPKMEDVKFVRKLSGPVEELQTMSLLDFRRLSKDPREAAEKLKGKIDLLEGQGYDKKIAGIKAWRESPLNRQYLALSGQAMLSGRSMQDLADEARRRSEEALTNDELSAILTLNSELRF